jgi:virginiamycin B lyase
MLTEVKEYPVGRGQGPHDVAPAADGGVWYTAQRSGELGHLDPKTGATRMVKLGSGSAPHGVIVGPDGAPWITDGGLNAVVRVDPVTGDVKRFPLPASRANANLNTATFDKSGTLWFTGQNGIFGRLDPKTGAMAVFDAPRGAGPYGIATCPDGEVYFASLAGSYVARIVKETGGATVLTPPTNGQGARRVWCDSRSRVWATEWNAGKIAVYDPALSSWQEYDIDLRPSTATPLPYAIYVDEHDTVWITDFAQNAILDFDISSGTYHPNALPSAGAAVRQLLGRPGEVWGAESATDKLVVIRIL